MWIIKDITARTLIWLAAIAVPVQGLPAAACSCASGKITCKAAGACCCSADKVRESRCCRARRQVGTAPSCCGSAPRGHDSPCTCGFHCQCRKGKLPTPATPSAASHQTEKMVGDAVSTISVAKVHRSQTMPRRADEFVDGDVLTAGDRCASLCRFTL